MQITSLMQIMEVGVPSMTSLAASLGRIDYADAFRARLPERAPREVDGLVRAVFLSAPRWVVRLLRLRNRIVRPFGLRTSFQREAGLGEGALEPGSHVALFEVYERTEERVLMGHDDRHLNFRVSVELRREAGGRVLDVVTAVRFNNVFGRLYFAPVRPIHRRVVPAMIRYGLREYSV